MPRLQQEATVTTEVAVEISPKLQAKLKAKLNEFNLKTAEKKAIETDLAERKIELETLFADAGEYEALSTGVDIHTPFGKVSMKIVEGTSAPKLNVKKLMTKFKLTPKDISSCTDPGKAKTPYLGVFLPKKDNDDGKDE